MVKEGVEDCRWFIHDREEVKSRKSKVHTMNGVLVDRAWKELRVADVVKIQKDEYFLSDLMLLSSSYEDDICYVETMNLNGEANLKIKHCMKCTSGFDDAVKFDMFNGTIKM
ncbi:HAD-like domain-containing protein [Artemisia annua]|uniref:HAD-like domain-containing protein n=1 Tax=Artemisia annua TaxID=35608 RepID=A0A2U1P292_ARTAN|nr:HAD-like domain-containing protein [Artemisia annua]